MIIAPTNVQTKKEWGITLISLIITIILLLILAGVVLNLTLGENGILKRASGAGEQYKISKIQEKLELEKVDLYARKNGKVQSPQEYINHLISKEIISASDVQDVDANSKNITVEGYLFLVEKEQSGNIKITYQGIATSEPKIASISVTRTTIDSISVKVVASNANGASYKYSIKNITTGETRFTLITTLSTDEYTFTGLTINNEYIIQVELLADKGTDTKETSTIKTEPSKVTSITLDKTNMELVVGETYVVTATVMPNEALDKTLTWKSSNMDVVTVEVDANDDTVATITAVGEGVAIITATSNEVSTVSAICNITVTLPPPPSMSAGGTTHEAHEIDYTWAELSQLAKIISDNYGDGEGQVNNDTAEVNVSINGKARTLGIGDWTTVEIDGIDYEVRILGFNHDTLVTSTTDDEGNEIAISQYGEGTTNQYAGISFEFVKCCVSTTKMKGYTWATLSVRTLLNDTTYESLENKNYIKEVNKDYYDYPNSALCVSQDKLWLLSSSEVWKEGSTGYNITKKKEGEQYKYYENVSSSGLKKVAYNSSAVTDWWLRARVSGYGSEYAWAYITDSGHHHTGNTASGSMKRSCTRIWYLSETVKKF